MELFHNFLFHNFSRQKESSSIASFATYKSELERYHAIPDEIEWTMLSASAFVNSVSSSTGYGDIVPLTMKGSIHKQRGQ